MSKKPSTVKDYQARMLRVLEYLSEHYQESLSLEQVAAVAHFSPYHFHRIFQAYMHETLYNYIRRLRLQKAAQLVAYHQMPITEIALQAGFESAPSFNKAFKQEFMMTPSELRQKGSLDGRFNPATIVQQSNEEYAMQPKIVNEDEREMLYVQRRGDYDTSCEDAWLTLINYVQSHNIDYYNAERIGICYDDPNITKPKDWRYDACLAGIKNPKADGEVGVKTFPGGRFAVFESVGSFEKLTEVFQYAYHVWWPKSGEALRDLPPFCKYQRLDKPYRLLTDAERAKLVTEVYLPLE